MSRPITTTRQARNARRLVPSPETRLLRHKNAVARRFIDARLAQSKQDLDTLEAMIAVRHAQEDADFEAQTWAQVPHHDGRK